jgi:soluble lytic murein transglycosylase-like protein
VNHSIKVLSRLGAAGLLLAFAHPGPTISMTQAPKDKQLAANRSAREQRLHVALERLLRDGKLPTPEKAGAVASAIRRASDAYGIPDSFLLAMIHQESRFDLGAVSNRGAVGLTQVLPTTAKAMDDEGLAPGRVDHLADPATSVLFGAAFLARLKRQYKSWDAVFTVYNMGPGNYEIHQALGENANGYAYAVLATEARWDAYLDGRGSMPLEGEASAL